MGLRATIINYLLTYSVNHEVRVWTKLAICYKVAQLTLIVLIGVLILSAIRGDLTDTEFVAADTPGSATTATEIKGVMLTNFSAPGLNDRIWDGADYIVPPLENGAKFIMTNIVITPRQTQGICEEDPSTLGARCDNSACEAGQTTVHGVKTGRCLNSTRLPGAKVCEVRAWCPVQRIDQTTRTPLPAFLESQNFSIFIKNDVTFALFEQKRRNLPANLDPDMPSCLFNQDDGKDKHCPVFRLDDIVRLAGYSYDIVAEEGGIFQIGINWMCEASDDDCLPDYNFTRLDQYRDNDSFRGFHLSYADHWELENGTLMRTLYRAYGLHLIFSVGGYMYKLDFMKIYFTAGSLYGSFAITTFMFNLFFIYRMIPDDKRYTDVHRDNTHHGQRHLMLPVMDSGEPDNIQGR